MRNGLRRTGVYPSRPPRSQPYSAAQPQGGAPSMIGTRKRRRFPISTPRKSKPLHANRLDRAIRVTTRSLIEGLEARQLLAAGDPYISEFLTENTNVIRDGHNVYSDYIEIHNPGAAPVNLNGWRLTDDKDLPGRFVFADFSIPAGGYRIVFATGTSHTDPGGYVHTNFGLNNGGEYLALSKPDGTIVSAFDPEYPQQSANVSYGIGPGGGAAATLLSSGAPARAHVPTAAGLNGWAAPTFPASTWTPVTTGIGFEANTTTTPPLPIELEPNSNFGQANNASANFAAAPANRYQLGFSGDISSTSDVDFYRIGALEPGDVITVSLSGSQSARGTLADPALELLRGGANGGVPVLADADTGPGSDALIYRFAVTQNDVYYVKASGAAGSTGAYQVGVFLENAGTAPGTSGNVTQEAEPNNTGTAATNVSLSWRNAQYLSRTSLGLTTDYFRFQFYAGDRVTVMLDSTSGTSGQVSLYNDGQALLAEENGTSDLAGADANDSSIHSYIIPATGTYYVFARPQVGSGGSFNLDVYLSTPNTPPRPAQLTGQFTSSVQGDMYNKNATAYLRVPFSSPAPANVSTLNLR